MGFSLFNGKIAASVKTRTQKENVLVHTISKRKNFVFKGWGGGLGDEPDRAGPFESAIVLWRPSNCIPRVSLIDFFYIASNTVNSHPFLRFTFFCSLRARPPSYAQYSSIFNEVALGYSTSIWFNTLHSHRLHKNASHRRIYAKISVDLKWQFWLYSYEFFSFIVKITFIGQRNFFVNHATVWYCYW